jgi:PDZ domain-containing secreted protein
MNRENNKNRLVNKEIIQRKEKRPVIGITFLEKNNLKMTNEVY